LVLRRALEQSHEAPVFKEWDLVSKTGTIPIKARKGGWIMTCPICKGKKVVDCPQCKGKGKKDVGAILSKMATCSHCKGTGKIKCSCA